MSRIHEALKKAEMERAGVSAEAPPARSQSSQAAANAAVTAGVLTEPIAPGREAFQFEELRERCAIASWRPDANVNVFLNPELSVVGAEQFRSLRSRLYQLRANQPLRTLLVTSPVAGEGKTFLTNNLGQAIVRQTDRRALIIDADLRCSRLHVPLGAASSPGLTDYLRGSADEIAVMQQGPERNLFFIPGGSACTNPSELLSNGRLKNLLERAGSAFDWIILDAPPCVPVADARILADICDGVLLVIKAGSTPAAVVQKARRELESANVVGVVLNAAEETVGYGSYYAGTYGGDPE